MFVQANISGSLYGEEFAARGFVPKNSKRWCCVGVETWPVWISTVLVNSLVYGELQWLENILKKQLLCLHTAQYASLYAAARYHCTAWGCPVILPRHSSIKPPVQETKRFWSSRCQPSSAAGTQTRWPHRKGERYLVLPWMQTINAWCACLNHLLFCCMTHLIL